MHFHGRHDTISTIRARAKNSRWCSIRAAGGALLNEPVDCQSNRLRKPQGGTTQMAANPLRRLAQGVRLQNGPPSRLHRVWHVSMVPSCILAPQTTAHGQAIRGLPTSLICHGSYVHLCLTERTFHYLDSPATATDSTAAAAPLHPDPYARPSNPTPSPTTATSILLLRRLRRR